MKAIAAKGAPAAIGPYSQAIEASGFLFLSGQIGLDPGSGKMVDGGVAPQTDRVLDNLGSVLNAAGCSFEDIVKTTIYLVDLRDFQLVNEIYGKRFTAQPPARATVQVAALPRSALVEIDAIAKLRH